MKDFRIVWAWGLLLAFAAAWSACAGGDQMSVEEYLARMQSQHDVNAERSEPFEAEFVEVFGSDVSLEERVEGSQRFFTEALNLIEETESELRALDPPAEVAALHDDFVQGLSDSAEAARAVIDLLDDVRSEDDLEAALNSYIFAFEPLDAPCIALEEFAADRGTKLDMDCQV